MAYTFKTDIDAQQFDAFVVSSDQNSILQGSKWAEIKSNWDSIRCGCFEDNRLVATALILIRKMPLGKTLFYIPRGPVMDYHNEMLVHYFLDEIVKLAKSRHAIAVRFDPALYSCVYPYVDREKEKTYQNQDVIDLLKAYGAKHKGFTTMISESTQPRYNAMMYPTPDYRDHLDRTTVKRISQAIGKGVKVYEGPEYVHDFATAMHFTEVRKQVALRNEEYFQHMLNVYGDHAMCLVAKLNFKECIEKLEHIVSEDSEKMASGKLTKKDKNSVKLELASAEKDLARLKEDYQREGTEEVITCGALSVYNDRLMECFYMGNNPEYMRLFSSFLLYSVRLDRCVELGIEKASLGGVEGTLDDGLTLFKSHWNMNVEEYIGEFNIVLDPFMYGCFDQLYPFLLKTAAKMRGKS